MTTTEHAPGNARDWPQDELARLDEQGLRRHLHPVASAAAAWTDASGQRWLNLASNDYLGMATDEDIIAAAARALSQDGAGAAASRLVTGTLPAHVALERELAEFLGQPRALVFGSGYLANLGVLDALCDRRSVVFGDRLNHASLIDGVRLAGARLQRYRHNDCDHLVELLRRHGFADGRRPIIVTDSVFSMDGDQARLADLATIAAEHDALLVVDEAHALGVLGPRGRGLCADAGIQADVITGGFGKALGGYGGFAATSEPLAEYFINRARTLIYSTGLPPASVASVHAALRRIRDRQGELGITLMQRVRAFRDALGAAGLELAEPESAILPIPVGDNHRAVAMAEALHDRGIICSAIRPPTVPAGTARLRATVTLGHSPDRLAEAANAFGEVAVHAD